MKLMKIEYVVACSYRLLELKLIKSIVSLIDRLIDWLFRSDLFVNRCTEDAHSDPHASLQVPGVRQGLLQALVASGTHPDAHGRASVQVFPLRSRLRRPLQPARAPADPRRRQALPLRGLHQGILPDVAARQTPGRKLRRRTVSEHTDRRILVSICFWLTIVVSVVVSRKLRGGQLPVRSALRLNVTQSTV